MLPILLIHGFPLDSKMWDAQAEHLRKQGRTVITPDLPGFGAAPADGREHLSIENFAEKIHGVIQTQAGGRAIVGGFSMGGYTLLALLRNFPDDVAAAMFIDTRADADSPEARANRLKSIAEVQANGAVGLVDAMLGKQLSRKPSPATQAKARAIMQRQSADGIIAALRAMAARRDQTELLSQLEIPVLIVVGAEDSMTPPSVALAMQSHMSQAMVVQIAGAGHLSPMEQPAAVNAALDTFLATLDAQDRGSRRDC